jgi:hypothetical protein
MGAAKLAPNVVRIAAWNGSAGVIGLASVACLPFFMPQRTAANATA